MLLQKQGFSFLELVIIIALLAIVSAITVPKLIERQKVATVEASAIKLLSFLELGASNSIKVGKPLYVHYVPRTQQQKACLYIDEKNELSACPVSGFTYQIDEQLLFDINTTASDKAAKLFSFSPITGLPSNDLTILLSLSTNKAQASGILVRRYKGLQGCSQTGMRNWQVCKPE